MTKREIIWSLCGFGLGIVIWLVVVFGFGMRAHTYDGRLDLLVLAGAGLGYLTAKVVRIGKRAT